VGRALRRGSSRNYGDRLDRIRVAHVPEFPISQGLNGAAAASGKPVVVQDVSQDPRWLTTFASTRAEAIYPVVGVGGTVVGTIDVESDRIGAFGPDDEALLAEAARVLRPFWIHQPTEGSA
jgi:putative methionine-R-sulfoxide reductase with GAF domain